MPHDSQKVSEAKPNESLGSLGSCLVEGDPEQRSRERRVRRRSLIVSILTQAAVVAMLILLPLFGRTERLALSKTFTPIPPYGHHRPVGDTTTSRPTRPPNPGSHFIYTLPTDGPVLTSSVDESPVGAPEIGPGGNQLGSGPECSWCIDIGGRNSGPQPPQTKAEIPVSRRIIETRLDPAMLLRRIEPAYPQLARQIHREGRVELRAIIATDGSIKSLEVVSGDPMFYQSALDAVSQWRYKPTILNGQAVEIDTHITVIYTMAH